MAAPLRYLALGDSYTIGEAVAVDAAWPMQLRAALTRHDIALAEPEILATTGWTTDELAKAMDAHDFTPPYDLVSLAIGVNNQYRGRSVDNYAAELETLLNRAIALAGGDAWRVFMLAIPDWGITRFGAESGRDRADIASQLDAFNACAQRLCRTLGVAFVDIAPISRQRGGEPMMQAEDGLHPSAALYAEWTRLAVPVVRELLNG